MKFYFVILLFVSFGYSAYSQNILFARKGTDFCFYDISSEEFIDIGKLNSNYIIRCHYQKDDSLFFCQRDFEIGMDSLVRYTVYIPLLKHTDTDTVIYHINFTPAAPVIKNEQMLRKDSLLAPKFKKGPSYTFSRIVDGYMIAARASRLYEIYGDTEKLYKSHYVGSFAAYYMSWGYSFPELTKDKKTLYYIDNYTFRYEGKRKLFNRIKDEKIQNRNYSYLIIADTKTKEVKKHIKIPFVHVGTIYQKKYRNIQLSPDDRFLLFEASPYSYLFNTETEEITRLPEGYMYGTWIK
jgi:hypothetical protein